MTEGFVYEEQEGNGKDMNEEYGLTPYETREILFYKTDNVLFLCVQQCGGIGGTINGTTKLNVEIGFEVLLIGVFFYVYGDAAFYSLELFVCFVCPLTLIDELVQHFLYLSVYLFVRSLYLGGIDAYAHSELLRKEHRIDKKQKKKDGKFFHVAKEFEFRFSNAWLSSWKSSFRQCLPPPRFWL